MIRLACVLLLLMAAAGPAVAEPLTLEAVLRSSARHAPQILEAMARERQAKGRVLSAEGAFDTVFEVDARSRALGYYGGSGIEARTTQPMTTNGGSMYAGYRLSSGAFPTYESGWGTNSLGEVKVGAVFSLLRDRFTDERRTRLDLTAKDVEAARLEREMVAIGVQRRAMDAYLSWAAAGLRVSIFRDLLQLAEARQTSIERQIELGSRPQVLSVENQQNIVRRRALLVRAEQDLAAAANALSFYYRDPQGAPLTPAPQQAPEAFPELTTPREQMADWRAGRPDLGAILVRLDQAAARRRLAENDLLPRLEVRAEASKDLGGGPMAAMRSPAEALLGLRLSLPLQRRQALGRVAEARAEADGLRLRHRLIEEQISVEVNGLVIQAEAAERLVELAVNEATLAARMADAERRRFALGASDFILVNLREEAAADARLRQLEAEQRRSAARAELVAATVDREQLQLSPLNDA